MTLFVVLQLLPAVVLFGALLCGRYPGERLIARVRRWRSQYWPRRPIAVRAVRRPRLVTPHGGVLLAHRIAGRGPPLMVA